MDTPASAIATSTGQGTFQSAIETGGIGFLADEPAAQGGGGLGPSPYDLLAAALATCTTMTLRFYAARKGWDIGSVSTHVTHMRDANASPPDRFSRTITLADTLDPAVRDELLGIANRCPVHKTLTRGTAVETTLA